MPFIRSKLIKGKLYFYLVEGYWVDGKSRQRVLCYLGRHQTVSAAYAYWQEQAKTGKDSAARKHAREMVKKLALYL